MPQQGIQRRGTESAIVRQPPSQDGIVHSANVHQAEIRSVAKIPLPRRLPHGLESRLADRRGKAHKEAVAFAGGALI